ncbi:hypothetical protein JVU11DRAFT_3659 [Chiua virens]|nr:hypothetical protein JVU11DRAFT_3659 [Chiua virens]
MDLYASRFVFMMYQRSTPSWLSADNFAPTPNLALMSSLMTSLRERTQTVLSYLDKTNSRSTFFNESEILSDFRDAINSNDESDEIFQTFHDNVHLSRYEDYSPFVSRFSAKSCRLSSIENLMSPDFPSFTAHSAGMSSGGDEILSEILSSRTHVNINVTDDAVRKSGQKIREKTASLLGFLQVIEGLNEVATSK